MSEELDQDSKTEQPTPQKLRKALEEGNSFISKDLINFFIILGFTLYFYFFLRIILKEWVTTLRGFLINTYQITFSNSITQQLLCVKKIGYHIIVFFLILSIFIICGAYLQRGHFVFSFNLIKPNFNRLSIYSGYKRIFSKKNLVDFIKNILKIIFFISLTLLLLISKTKNLSFYQNLEMKNILNIISIFILNLLIVTSIFTLIIGLLDWHFQKKTYIDSLKMTKHEVKREFKESEGDPNIKQSLKALRGNLLKKNLRTKIKEASVVITNPTHFAIALKYDIKKHPAPICLSKTKYSLAQFVKKLAKEYSIPIVENPILARSLYKDLKENQLIPEKYFKEIAKIIAHILYTDQKIQKNSNTYM